MRYVAIVLLGAGLAVLAAPAQAKKCPADSVQVGSLCVDKYEASAWETTDATTIKNIKKGKVDAVSDLALATQRGASGDDYGPGCPDDGSTGCSNLYAVSLAGVTPSTSLTWFQAAAACANAGKRLLTNQEWTVAALGTPDPGADDGSSNCNTNSTLAVANTGSRSACVSTRGAFDMAGNVWEWVADWVPLSNSCPGWGVFSNDTQCFAGVVPLGSGGPGGLMRGGDFNDGTAAGPLAVLGSNQVSGYDVVIGFRCARPL